MNKLRKLIDELCPNGVIYKNFYDVATYIRGITYNKTDEINDDNDGISVLRANNITLESLTLNTNEIKKVKKTVKIKEQQWLCKDDILICAGSGSKEHIGKTAYIKENMKLTFGGFMGVIRCTSINPRFMFHILTSPIFKKHLSKVSGASSSTINNINIDTWKNFLIPVPPLEVQDEIVRILDNFTELTTELTAELQDRKKQYEYYRDSLLTFNNDIRLYKLRDVATFNVGVKPDKILEVGNIKYINAGTTESGFTVDSNTVGDTVTTPSRGQGGIGYVGYQYEPFWCGPLCYRIRSTDNNKLINKYLYYFMCSRKNIILEMKHEGGVPALNGKELGELLINVPSLEIQERIVNVLDNFEKICNDLKIGLPAEIELRQKQYEYYRDMLLTFPENDFMLKQASKQASKQA